MIWEHATRQLTGLLMLPPQQQHHTSSGNAFWAYPLLPNCPYSDKLIATCRSRPANTGAALA